jgi:stage V sporulation protein K
MNTRLNNKRAYQRKLATVIRTPISQTIRNECLRFLMSQPSAIDANETIMQLGRMYYEAGIEDFNSWFRLLAQDVVDSGYSGSYRDFSIVFVELQEGYAAAHGNRQADTSRSSQGSDDNGTLSRLLAKFDSLTGLETVKKELGTLVSSIKVDSMRREHGLRVARRSLHIVFEGNPGTGKTTTARLVAQIYKELGVLRKGQLICTDRAAMVAGYVGQTASQVDTIVQSALGGVLFIDEAYSLAPPYAGNDFGLEAIQQLLLMMENHRDDLAVIVAGYPEEMKRFINANPGLSSRFTKVLNFADYSPEQLLQIFERMCRENDYGFRARAAAKLLHLFSSLYVERDKNFGNARLARNLFEKATTNLANRVVQSGSSDRASLMEITEEDIDSVTTTERGQIPVVLISDHDDSWSVEPVDDAEKRLAALIDPDEVKGRDSVLRSDADDCDICGCNVEKRGLIIDGRLQGDLKWANMCADCFGDSGAGIGWGRGQLYARQLNGDWRLVAGFAPDEE